MADPGAPPELPLPTRCAVAGLTRRHALVGYSLVVAQVAGQARVETALCRVHDAARAAPLTLVVRSTFAPGARTGNMEILGAYPADGEIPQELHPTVLARLADVFRRDKASVTGDATVADAFSTGAWAAEPWELPLRLYRLPLTAVSAPLDDRWLVTGFNVLGSCPAAAPAPTPDAQPQASWGPSRVDAVLCRVLDAAGDRLWWALAEAVHPDPGGPAALPKATVTAVWPSEMAVKDQKTLIAALELRLPSLLASPAPAPPAASE